MSNLVQGLVWNIPFPNCSAKMVALKLADNANDEGANVYPSTKTVAHKTSLSRSKVCKWLAAMEHSGLLVVKVRSLGGPDWARTERAFDMNLLRRLAWPKPEIPAELELIESTIDREAVAKDGSTKAVRVAVLTIRPYRSTVPVEDGSGGSAVPVGDGSGGSAVPVGDGSGGSAVPLGDGSGGSAVPLGDSSRPPGGHELFKSVPLIKNCRKKKRHQQPSGTDGACATVPLKATELALAESAAFPALHAVDNRLPFTVDVLRQIEAKGEDPTSVIDRYLSLPRSKKRAIKNPCAYVLAIADDLAQKRLGVSVEQVKALGSRNPARNAAALAQACGAFAAPSPACLARAQRLHPKCVEPALNRIASRSFPTQSDCDKAFDAALVQARFAPRRVGVSSDLLSQPELENCHTPSE